jgi:hypothetical protein
MARLREFLEQRIKEASSRPEVHREELAAFGWWFTSGKLDWDWAFGHLERVLQLTHGYVDPAYKVLETLASSVSAHPLEAVTALHRIVARDHDRLLAISQKQEVRDVIRTALQSDDEVARNAARELTNKLFAMGHREFIDLLDEGT